MIERLKESGGAVIGFKVVGRISGEEVKAFEPQIEFVIAQRKKRPIGILADLSQMEGADWKARWAEMRFLQKYTEHIARMAVVGADKWEEVVAMVLAGTAVLQAETRYFTMSEIDSAWKWVRTSKDADRVPIRRLYAGTGLFKDYIPEYTDL
jgi:SpoIIAA-like